MEYNDFQIASDEAYKLMNEQFNNLSKFDRRTSLNQIIFCIQDCKVQILNISPSINLKIKKAIQTSSQALNKIDENLRSLFNLDNTHQQTIREFNLFTYLKNLTKLISLFQTWSKFEKKEYYLNFIFKTVEELLENIKIILQSLENSNIYLFKFM